MGLGQIFGHPKVFLLLWTDWLIGCLFLGFDDFLRELDELDF